MKIRLLVISLFIFSASKVLADSNAAKSLRTAIDDVSMEGISRESIEDKSEYIEIRGLARTNMDIAAYMDLLKASIPGGDVDIYETRQITAKGVYHKSFILKIKSSELTQNFQLQEIEKISQKLKGSDIEERVRALYDLLAKRKVAAQLEDQLLAIARTETNMIVLPLCLEVLGTIAPNSEAVFSLLTEMVLNETGIVKSGALDGIVQMSIENSKAEEFIVSMLRSEDVAYEIRLIASDLEVKYLQAEEPGAVRLGVLASKQRITDALIDLIEGEKLPLDERNIVAQLLSHYPQADIKKLVKDYKERPKSESIEKQKINKFNRIEFRAKELRKALNSRYPEIISKAQVELEEIRIHCGDNQQHSFCN